MKILTIAAILSFSTPILASEIDSFTGRLIPIADSLEIINRKANQLLAKGIRLANQEGHGCNEKKLYKILRKRFRNKYTDEFSKWASSSSELDRVRTPIKKSIYQDWTVFEAPVQGGWARWVSDPSASLLKVNNELIGDDKFEHFFGSGFNYFQKNYLKSKGVSAALKHGWKAETGLMGSFTTGVMAFADLSANFNGMRFWNHVLQKEEDVLGQNIGPYIVCEKGQWIESLKPIDMGAYIDSSLDESINCSAFNGVKLIEKVSARIEKLNEKHGTDYKCPMDVDKLKTIWRKYGKYAPYLINVEGNIDKPKMKFKEYIKLTPTKVERRTGFKP